jgi:hypothetical protein
MEPVHSKAKFYELWEANALGNRTRIWRDPQEAETWGMIRAYEASAVIYRHNHFFAYPEIGFREIRRGAGAGKWEKVPWSKVMETAKQWRAEGRRFIMDDGAPDDKRSLQGEVVRTERGLEGFLDLVGRLPMRPAMAAGHMQPYGYLQTKLLLDRYMDASSRADLDELLEQYPDHAVEFSTFRVPVGTFGFGRNTIFWETRLY